MTGGLCFTGAYGRIAVRQETNRRPQTEEKGTIILTMLLVFVIEVCLIYTLEGKMDTLLQFTKIFSVFLLVLLAGQLRDAGKRE